MRRYWAGRSSRSRGDKIGQVIVTVIGRDRVGIIARVATLLAEHNINILDISQTVMQEYFSMIMVVDLSGCDTGIHEVKEALHRLGEEMGLSMRIQHEDIFQAMHRI